jgi:hypothetical protein
MLVLLLWLYTLIWSRSCDTRSIALFAQDCFSYLGLFFLHVNFRIGFLSLQRMAVERWWALPWICRLLLAGQPFHTVDSDNPGAREAFPFSSVVFKFCLQGFVAFIVELYRSFTKLVRFIPRAFGFSRLLWMELFLSLFIVGVQKTYWFLYVDFVSCYISESVFQIWGSLVNPLGLLRVESYITCN